MSIHFVTVEGFILTICLARGWQALRKCARELLTFQARQQHLEIQHAEATQLMFDILSEPTVSPTPKSPST